MIELFAPHKSMPALLKSICFGVKTVGGVTTANPILTISGVTDTAILITDHLK